MAQSQKFQGTARKIIPSYNGDMGGPMTTFYYHNTAIVQVFGNGNIKLNSGGWRTATTKLAMNQASNEFNLGFSVSQRKGVWYVTTAQYGEMPFEDGMTIRDGWPVAYLSDETTLLYGRTG